MSEAEYSAMMSGDPDAGGNDDRRGDRDGNDRRGNRNGGTEKPWDKVSRTLCVCTILSFPHSLLHLQPTVPLVLIRWQVGMSEADYKAMMRGDNDARGDRHNRDRRDGRDREWHRDRDRARRGDRDRERRDDRNREWHGDRHWERRGDRHHDRDRERRGDRNRQRRSDRDSSDSARLGISHTAVSMIERSDGGVLVRASLVCNRPGTFVSALVDARTDWCHGCLCWLTAGGFAAKSWPQATVTEEPGK